jgi:hypothetical protein
MQTIEQESHEIKTIASQYQYDSYNYDYSSSELPNEGSYGTETIDSSAEPLGLPAPESASATEGAESPSAVSPEESIAYGAEAGPVSEPPSSDEYSEPGSSTSEHQA